MNFEGICEIAKLILSFLQGQTAAENKPQEECKITNNLSDFRSRSVLPDSAI